MTTYLTNQEKNFEVHLKELIGRPVMKYSLPELKEKISTIDIKPTKDLAAFSLDFLFDYKIFPPNIMTFKTQWGVEKRKMKIGDTIVQQAFLPPLSVFSLKIILGVRINSVIHEPARQGFSYETLEGHVEKGESLFTLEQHERGILFKIHTFSKPGNLLTKVAAPFFSLPYQAYCTRCALMNVKAVISYR